MPGQFGHKNKHKSNKKLLNFSKKENDKIYHGSFHRKSNGTRKLIDFEGDKNCICLTSNLYWKIDVKEKYLRKEFRQITRQYAEEIKPEYGQKSIGFKQL